MTSSEITEPVFFYIGYANDGGIRWELRESGKTEAILRSGNQRNPESCIESIKKVISLLNKITSGECDIPYYNSCAENTSCTIKVAPINDQSVPFYALP